MPVVLEVEIPIATADDDADMSPLETIDPFTVNDVALAPKVMAFPLLPPVFELTLPFTTMVIPVLLS